MIWFWFCCSDSPLALPLHWLCSAPALALAGSGSALGLLWLGSGSALALLWLALLFFCSGPPWNFKAQGQPYQCHPMPYQEQPGQKYLDRNTSGSYLSHMLSTCCYLHGRPWFLQALERDTLLTHCLECQTGTVRAYGCGCRCQDPSGFDTSDRT